MNDER
jgi:hypothetical protein